MPAVADGQISVLVVDDDRRILDIWRHILAGEPFFVHTLDNPVESLTLLKAIAVDVVVSDLMMEPIDGMALLEIIKRDHPDIEVVMMTGFGGVREAVRAIQAGAYDFLTKPIESREHAAVVVRRAAERRLLRRQLGRWAALGSDSRAIRGMVGQSAALRRVFELVQSVAGTAASVLICGESGTGKELVARALHEKGPRADAPLVKLNCAALSESLLENELFGHRRGAFTGAASDRRGLFEAADGGTLFLDEVSELSAATQSKLLRTLQDGEVRPLGSAEAFHVDVRIIAATNVSLEERCSEGSFRSDLFYRLNVVQIDLPPLRERGDDIALLAHHALNLGQQKLDRRCQGFTPEAMSCLRNHDWPGNVRELINTVERALLLVSPAGMIGVTELPARLTERAQPLAPCEPSVGLPFSEARALALRRFERSYLAGLMQRSDSIHAAARTAGMDRSNLRRLLRRHGLLE